MEESNDMDNSPHNLRDHLANERTFLAWVRTSIGLMAFGFVLEKFSFFIRQISILLSNKSYLLNEQKFPLQLQGYSAMCGVMLVILGTLICLFSFIKYINTKKQIDSNNYTVSILLDIILMLIVFFAGLFLAIYLVRTI